MVSMSWNFNTVKIAAGLAILIQGIHWPPAASAADAEMCPAQTQTASPLKYVGVFDGPPERLVSLMADDEACEDKPKDNSGYFTLRHIYEAGRFVTIQCVYTDGSTSSVKLSKKVDGCKYSMAEDKVVSFICR
jgi:hypothetical protein